MVYTVHPENEHDSRGVHCAHCLSLGSCTHSKNHVKTVTRYVWEEYMEMVEDIRHTRGNREIYARRKETIERIFGTVKEQHGFRYTQYIGRVRMEMKAGLTFACMNLKKLTRILAGKGKGGSPFQDPPHTLKKIYLKIKERRRSLTPASLFVYSLQLLIPRELVLLAFFPEAVVSLLRFWPRNHRFCSGEWNRYLRRLAQPGKRWRNPTASKQCLFPTGWFF